MVAGQSSGAIDVKAMEADKQARIEANADQWRRERERDPLFAAYMLGAREMRTEIQAVLLKAAAEAQGFVDKFGTGQAWVNPKIETVKQLFDMTVDLLPVRVRYPNPTADVLRSADASEWEHTGPEAEPLYEASDEGLGRRAH